MILTPGQLQDKLEGLATPCDNANRKYVEAKRRFNAIDDIRHIKQAQIESSIKGNAAERKRQALVSGEWLDYVDQKTSLRYDMDLAKLERDNLQRQWDTCRSLLSCIKKEIDKL